MTTGLLATIRSRIRAGAQDHRRLANLLVPLAVGALLASLVSYFIVGGIAGDAYTYLAAGERLNAGHALYALGPGDRPVALKPPYWTVPLLSPPLIAVLWRPLAALPDGLGMILWWAGGWICLAILLEGLLRRRPVRTALVILPLTFSLTFEFGVANVNPYLWVGTLGVWLLARRRRDAAAGALAATLALIKLTPVVLVLWLLTLRRWLAVGAALVVGSMLLVVSILGAGLQAHLDFLMIARSTAAAGASDLSPPGLLRGLGVPEAISSAAPLLVLGLGTAAMVLAKDRPALSFSLAVVLLVLATPVVYINTFTALILVLVPSAWPWAPARDVARLPEKSGTSILSGWLGRRGGARTPL